MGFRNDNNVKIHVCPSGLRSLQMSYDKKGMTGTVDVASPSMHDMSVKLAKQ
jgi:hypothetical protein